MCPPPPKTNPSATIKLEISGILLMALSFLIFLSIINPSIGVVAGWTNSLLAKLAGEGRFLVPLFLVVVGLKLVLVKNKTKVVINLTGLSMLVAVMLALLHTQIPRRYILQSALKGDGGGLIGGIINYLLINSFGFWGLYVVLLALFLIGLLLITNQSMTVLISSTLGKITDTLKKTIRGVDNFLFTAAEQSSTKVIKQTEEPPQPLMQTVIIDGCSTDILDKNDAVNEVKSETETACLDEINQDLFIPEAHDDLNDNDPINKKSNVIYYRPVSRVKAKTAAPFDAPLKTKSNRQQDDARPDQADDALYQLPPLSLLKQPVVNKKDRLSQNIAASVQRLEATLVSFGIRCKVTQVTRGPAITRYEVQPPPGVKVSRIVGLADDIALNMASSDVRIEAPIPGKAVVGIEVPNQQISMVYLRELVETTAFKQTSSYITIALGKDIAGQPVVDDLARMPHLLIAGATGSGKSVCLNTILGSILYKATPSQVKLLIIDPKMVELSVYNNIPHLVSPVVTDPKKAATSLRWAVKEMEYRYGLFAQAGVRDITRYNKLALQTNQTPLPLLVIVIDELADLMMVAPADVEDGICRLAQMARAAGIHLVIATQRPSVDIITGLIKANIPSRISFAVSSQIDSRTILDMGGAEKLLGRGDMLYYPVGSSKPTRVLGAYLSDREVEQLVEHWSKQALPIYDDNIGQQINKEFKISNWEDDLLPLAVKTFIETGHASISLLQRRLHIGYARAARLVDLMEQKGYVGSYEGSKPRTVLITDEEYQNNFGATLSYQAGCDK